MIRFAIGLVAGIALGSKMKEGDLEDMLQIAQQTLRNEQVAGLVRAGAGALGEAIRVLGDVITEEVPARLEDRHLTIA